MPLFRSIPNRVAALTVASVPLLALLGCGGGSSSQSQSVAPVTQVPVAAQGESSTQSPVADDATVEPTLSGQLVGTRTVPTRTPLPPGIVRIACVGDSITAGAGTVNAGSNSYPFVLGRLLGSRYSVGNFGAVGATMLSGLRSSYRNSAHYQRALAFRPDIVIIELGTNDSIIRDFSLVQKNFPKDYKAMIADFKRLNPKTQFFICVPPAFNPPSLAPHLENGMLRLTREVARNNGATAIDLHTLLYKKPQYYFDKVHPNNQGAELVARKVYQMLTR